MSGRWGPLGRGWHREARAWPGTAPAWDRRRAGGGEPGSGMVRRWHGRTALMDSKLETKSRRVRRGWLNHERRACLSIGVTFASTRRRRRDGSVVDLSPYACLGGPRRDQTALRGPAAPNQGRRRLGSNPCSRVGLPIERPRNLSVPPGVHSKGGLDPRRVTASERSRRGSRDPRALGFSPKAASAQFVFGSAGGPSRWSQQVATVTPRCHRNTAGGPIQSIGVGACAAAGLARGRAPGIGPVERGRPCRPS